MPLTVEQFISALETSGLAPADEVRAIAHSLPGEPQPADAQQLANELVRRRLLTSYQLRAIWQGKQQSLVLGNYVVLDKLGQGGMGMVLLARHKRMNRTVALKVLSRELLRRPEAIKRVQREVEAAARLDHPNIVTAYDADQAAGVHFFVMQYVEGTDLSSLVRKHGRLPVDQAVECVVQTARGLEYAHARGIVHRDIKPGNLLLDKSGTIKILDMGLARISDGDDQAQSELTATGAVMGTIEYMSPEQALNTKRADHRADIYSLGITLWYLLVGKPPYEGTTVMEKLLAHREAPIPSLAAARADVPPALDAVFQRMVAKKPEQRQASMAQVITELEMCRATMTSGGSPARSPAIPGGMARDDRQLADFLKGLADQQTQRRSAGAAVAPAAEQTMGAGALVDTDPDTRGKKLPPRRRGATVRVKKQSVWKARWFVNAAAVLGAILLVWLGVQLLSQRGSDGKQGRRPQSTADGRGAAPAQGPASDDEPQTGNRGLADQAPGDDTKSAAGKKAQQASAAQAATTPREVYDATRWQAGEKIPLFNGTNLAGWTRMDFSPAQWAWDASDQSARAVPGAGSIRTTATFGLDFLLHAEFWLPKIPGATGQKKANSGIFLLGRHEIQILDMTNNPGVRPEQGLGALYDKIAPKNLDPVPPETWQSLDLTFHSPRRQTPGGPLVPGRLTVLHNWKTIIDDAPVVPEASLGAPYSGVGQPGPIVLQELGSAVRFRNLYVRLLEPKSSAPAKVGSATKTPDLAQGASKAALGEWRSTDPVARWTVEPSLITGEVPISGIKKNAFLYTARPYRNFQFDFEVRMPRGNSGVQIRSQVSTTNSFTSMTGPQVEIAKGGQRAWASLVHEPNGEPSINADKALVARHLKPDDFNQMTIRCVGKHLVVSLNGKVIIDADCPSMADEGYVGLQLHKGAPGMKVEFRNVQLRALP